MEKPISSDQNKRAKNVGNLTDESTELKNTYLITTKGLLIPDLIYFFGDSFAHSAAGLTGSITNFDFYMKQNFTSVIKTQHNLFEGAKDARYKLDEILAICDPDNSFGIVKTNHKGVYPEDTNYFFNSDNLRDLFNYASLPQFNPETCKGTKHHADFKRLWNQMRNEYFKVYEPLIEKDHMAHPVPEGVLKLGLQFETD
ncbi:MAG: hypothetical protein Q8O89_04270 [Nanoarchaeota archaeon]|nr:hypothetical protein [Nanoarchaeota archaeon]